MSLESSISGRACLLQWRSEITIASVFALLTELNRTRLLAGKPVIAILHVSLSIRTPGPHVLDSLKGGLASVIGACERLVVALEGESADRTLLRAAFTEVVSASNERGLRIFDNLNTALLYAQRLAPHDVLELQRDRLRRSLPPR